MPAIVKAPRCQKNSAKLVPHPFAWKKASNWFDPQIKNFQPLVIGQCALRGGVQTSLAIGQSLEPGFSTTLCNLPLYLHCYWGLKMYGLRYYVPCNTLKSVYSWSLIIMIIINILLYIFTGVKSYYFLWM